MAPVRIAVDGPQNATVRVNGTELRDWFGTQSLPVGQHLFEFIPPNSECCEAAPRFVVEIEPPSGGEPQRVRGRIEFKHATLECASIRALAAIRAQRYATDGLFL
jgi:hypothetical protein